MILALTANRHYALRGVRPGARIGPAARRLHLGRSLRIGRNHWYLIAGRRSTGVLKVQHGVVREVGIASTRLTQGRAAGGGCSRASGVSCAGWRVAPSDMLELPKCRVSGRFGR